MIEVGGITIPDEELDVQFTRAGGPGGQHVNKTETAVQLRFNVWASPSLPNGVKRRLADLAPGGLTNQGELILDARGHRSQKRNRDEAEQRFRDLLLRAARPPKKRKKTRPTLASKRRRLERKKQRSEQKRLRQPPKRP
jgi:ribosome-associated protein